MLNVEDVLTSTAVVLQRVPGEVRLADHVNDAIKGLNKSCEVLSDYTLDDIAIKLPGVTKEPHCEHTELLAFTSTHIAKIIRSSLSVIKTHIVPACDIIEANIKKMGQFSTIKDMIFNKLFLNFYHLSEEILESRILPDEPDTLFKEGVKFDVSNLTQLGTWAPKSYEEILPFISSASNYPELHAALRDKGAVEGAWATLGKRASWLFGASDHISPSSVDIKPTDIYKLIILTLLVSKMAGEEDPHPDVTNIELEVYRTKLASSKRFLNTVLYHTIERYKVALAKGLFIADSEVDYAKCEEKESRFFGGMVLSGGAMVVYNDAIAKYFSENEKYSLSSTVVGLLIAKFKNKISQNEKLIDSLDFYHQLDQDYTDELNDVVLMNSRLFVKNSIYDAMYEIVKCPEWKTALSEDGKYENLPLRLEELIRVSGGIYEVLALPSVVDEIMEGKLHVSDTSVAVTFAKVLGVEAAKEILSNNIANRHKCVKEQRVALASSIVEYIVKKLVV